MNDKEQLKEFFTDLGYSALEGVILGSRSLKVTLEALGQARAFWMDGRGSKHDNRHEVNLWLKKRNLGVVKPDTVTTYFKMPY